MAARSRLRALSSLRFRAKGRYRRLAQFQQILRASRIRGDCRNQHLRQSCSPACWYRYGTDGSCLIPGAPVGFEADAQSAPMPDAAGTPKTPIIIASPAPGGSRRGGPARGGGAPHCSTSAELYLGGIDETCLGSRCAGMPAVPGSHASPCSHSSSGRHPENPGLPRPAIACTTR